MHQFITSVSSKTNAFSIEILIYRKRFIIYIYIYIYINVVVLHTVVFSSQPFPLKVFKHSFSIANITWSILHGFFKIKYFCTR